ncbi:ATP:cob(I)alamin adenosyltransferase [Candidatus Nitrosarchaeum limnium BG20]|jgi:cob(I)alamin adenosyltransferase|uniref:ATP:cob(I)alamin adenosyltransferase n=1 Tax=Candidatus Nitrosarchaeum limnium BG20 TaxID=859192 RepID=S2E211_9ARCH|nr:ATP:cob(I)alamin adenosyltransferase [Candidatus Nitrosarchaeum limnium BG20]
MVISNSNNIIVQSIFDTLLKIYTKTGDDGTTGLQGNLRISKSHPRISAYGAVDESNAILGIVLSHELNDDIRELLNLIQNELFVVGSDLSNPNLKDEKNRVTLSMITNIENNIDKFESELSPLTNFILPGGNLVASQLHHARTVIRRSEICMVILNEQEKINPYCMQYVNRLSDLFFVLGRVLNKRNGHKDIIWQI